MKKKEQINLLKMLKEKAIKINSSICKSFSNNGIFDWNNDSFLIYLFSKINF